MTGQFVIRVYSNIQPRYRKVQVISNPPILEQWSHFLGLMSPPSTRSFYLLKLDIIYGTRRKQTYTLRNIYIYVCGGFMNFIFKRWKLKHILPVCGWVNFYTIQLAARPLWPYFFSFCFSWPPYCSEKSGCGGEPFAMEHSILFPQHLLFGNGRSRFEWLVDWKYGKVAWLITLEFSGTWDKCRREIRGIFVHISANNLSSINCDLNEFAYQFSVCSLLVGG